MLLAPHLTKVYLHQITKNACEEHELLWLRFSIVVSGARGYIKQSPKVEQRDTSVNHDGFRYCSLGDTEMMMMMMMMMMTEEFALFIFLPFSLPPVLVRLTRLNWSPVAYHRSYKQHGLRDANAVKGIPLLCVCVLSNGVG
jgi:hypothetical protein